MRSAHRVLALLGGLGGLSVVQSCCDDFDLGLGDLGGRMAFGVDASVDVEFDWDVQVSWGGTLDFGAWSNLGASADANIHFDSEGYLAFETGLDLDIDGDGVAEAVSYVGFAESDPSNIEQIFAAWRGDRFSFDAGTCYLMWWNGGTVELLSGSCGGSGILIHCAAREEASRPLDCDACDSAGVCVDCSSGQTVSSCQSHGEEQLDEAEPSGSGSEGQAGDGAANRQTGGAPAGGAGGNAGVPSPGGAGGATEGVAAAGVGQSVSGAGGESAAGASSLAGAGGESAAGASSFSGGISLDELTVCEAAVGELRTAGQGCGLAEVAAADALCASSFADVSACYLAMEAASLFGNACDALREDLACGSVFP